ncbi:Aldehyde Dehydrogenase [Methanocaldococcus vulcanius M7]|uniref:Lactaldehyde dehydrogenase n=1 Tax=Methanocaldococcus vulcanius (strain ATCC 700851 / DSM 12094 / M7) TaxID=579137 RepID=C9RGC0_METVM|nr:lactaldehyde dehydrogenase [Methanocaldococcus vulcanius]ACX72622.1 Aldehyde Dehydrogenase [Methanocaldococcus vulcanius M7]
MLINGHWIDRKDIDVINPYTLEVIEKIPSLNREEVKTAIDIAEECKDSMKNTSISQRYKVLIGIANKIKENSEKLSKILAIDAGKPIKQARIEVKRSVETFLSSAFYVKELRDEVIPSDNRLIFTKREPVGIVGAITPFNFPINLSAHKIAPAIATGNVVVHHPSSKAPLACIELAKIIEEEFRKYNVPLGSYSLLTGLGEIVGDEIVKNDKVNMISFTGSSKVGEGITKKAGFKKIALELGGVNPNLVLKDADLKKAVNSLIRGSFVYAGQICISVGKIVVEESVADKFIKMFVEKAKSLNVGDPLDENTDMGPLITLDHAKWAENLVKRSVEEGSKLLCGGKRDKTLFYPTVLEVEPDNIICKVETFAPIVPIIRAKEEEMIEIANDTQYGLHSAIFTKNLEKALKFAENLEFGGVIINDSSLFRQDNMPFGGVKKSGIGREGVKYAMEEMSNIKTIVITH